MSEDKERKLVVAAYISTFLPSDMRHVFRQIVGQLRYTRAVLTRKRQNEEAFPLHPKQLTVIRRPKTRAFRRWWFGKVKKAPVPLTYREVRDALYALQKYDSDVLHVYFGNIAAQLVPLLRTVRHPVVVSFHGADAGVDVENPAYRSALGEVFELAELVLARSTSLLDRLCELGCPAEKLRLNRAGIPLEQVPFELREVPPAGRAWRLLQACRLVEKKGLPTALRAFAKIRAEHPSAEFHIAGDGPLRGELDSLAAELGIADAVKFHGFLGIEDLFALMRDSHLFVHPSQTGEDGNREGVPNSMLEAMSSGLPVLATRHGGIPEAVPERGAGLLVDERDHEALAAAALELMADPELYRECARGARASVDGEFSLRTTLEKLEGFYDEAIEIARASGK